MRDAQAKKNLRLLVCPPPAARRPRTECRQLSGGLLLQTADRLDAPGDDPANWKLGRARRLRRATLADLAFAWRACRAREVQRDPARLGGATVGVGMGQVNRVDSCRLAVARAGDRAVGSVAATDAFFPFADGLQVLTDAGVRAIVEPGGSIRDDAGRSRPRRRPASRCTSPAPGTSSTDDKNRHCHTRQALAIREAFMSIPAGSAAARRCPMTAKILDGKATAAAIQERAGRAGRRAAPSAGIVPGLGTVLVGDDPGSRAYVDGKHRDCAEVGIASIRRDLPADATQEQVEAVVDELNADPACTGYIVQLPLPDGLDDQRVLERIDPAKDADGLHPVNLGRLVLMSRRRCRARRAASSSCCAATTCRSPAPTSS